MARLRPRARWVALVAAGAVAVSACSVILGVDGDYTIGEFGGGSEASTDAGSEGSADGGADGLTTQDAPTIDGNFGPCPVCTDAGGTCPTSSVCNFACASACSNKTLQCPPGLDCTVQCAGGCDRLKCVGGKSCTIQCQGTGSCDGVACESDRCDIRCSGKDSCGPSPALVCDAGVCQVTCTGEASCKAGIGARGSTYCGIACTGLGSCNAGGTRASCTSPDASVTCGPATDACKDGKPSCQGSFCALTCTGTVGSVCGAGYCCNATTCAIDAVGRSQSCP